MENLCAVICCFLLSVGVAAAQTAGGGDRRLPQWLTGIIAVTGFLFLSFVVFLVKRSWCDGSERRATTDVPIGETQLEVVRNKDGNAAYENLVFDGAEDKVTVM